MGAQYPLQLLARSGHVLPPGECCWIAYSKRLCRYEFGCMGRMVNFGPNDSTKQYDPEKTQHRKGTTWHVIYRTEWIWSPKNVFLCSSIYIRPSIKNTQIFAVFGKSNPLKNFKNSASIDSCIHGFTRSCQVYLKLVKEKWPKLCIIQQIKQKSWAIAKLTARCALYMGALKIFRSPWQRPRLYFSWIFNGLLFRLSP